ncbi:hypothetical protein ACP70R_017108 [Stipagrostis hirtigluma subsp. patula]
MMSYLLVAARRRRRLEVQVQEAASFGRRWTCSTSTGSSATPSSRTATAPATTPPGGAVRVGVPEDDDEVAVEQEEDHAAAAAGNDNQQQAVEVDDDDLNWALHRAPSMPLPSSAMTRPRRACPGSGTRKARWEGRADATEDAGEVRSFSANKQPVVVRSKSAFHDKKCKSSSYLESIEAQGFKDLGFVFDKKELRENLAYVLPASAAGRTPPSTTATTLATSDKSVNMIASRRPPPVHNTHTTQIQSKVLQFCCLQLLLSNFTRTK